MTMCPSFVKTLSQIKAHRPLKAMRYLIPNHTDLPALPIKERLFWRGFHKCRMGGDPRRRSSKAEVGTIPRLNEVAKMPLKHRLFWRGFHFCKLGGQNRKTGKIPKIKMWVNHTGISFTDFLRLHQYLPWEHRSQLWLDYVSICPPSLFGHKPLRGQRKKYD